jgi:hypothetical protein
VSANGEETDWSYEGTNGEFMISLPERAGEVPVEVRF